MVRSRNEAMFHPRWLQAITREREFEKGVSLRRRLLLSLAFTIVPLVAVTGVAMSALQTTVELSETNIHVGRTEVLPALKLESRINGASALLVLVGAPGADRVYDSYVPTVEKGFKSVGVNLSQPSRLMLAKAHDQWLLGTQAIQRWRGLPYAQRQSTALKTQDYFVSRVIAARKDLVTIADRQAQLNWLRLHRQEKTRNIIFVVLGITCVVGILAALLGAWRLARAILVPLNGIGRGLERLGRGDLSYRLPKQHADELGAVSIAVNAMASQLQRQQNDLIYHARHDPLTGLPNRWLLSQRLEEALSLAKLEERSMAVLILDLDRFKEVNDTLGHHYGDLLLQQIGPRIQDVLRPDDVVARLGGDEFAVLLSVGNLSQAESCDMFMLLASRVKEALATPFLIGELSLAVDASAGIAVFPSDGDTAELLLQRADVAMYVAKRTQIGPVFYDSGLDEHNPRKLALLARLREAINFGELICYYQPIIDLSTDVVVGVEALVRWQHPEEGLLGPMEFVPLAESSGDIRQLTVSVLNQALEQCRQWTNDGNNLSVSVNVSARSLLDTELPGIVAAALAQANVPGNLLKLEITESAIVADPPRAIEILGKLGQLGVCISVDDFGTGYSSIAYLRDLPVQELKVDRSFVERMLYDERDAAIVRSSIELAHRLGMTVVAEGVESRAVHESLCNLNADYSQGYFYSTPMPVGVFDNWLAKWKNSHNNPSSLYG